MKQHITLAAALLLMTSCGATRGNITTNGGQQTATTQQVQQGQRNQAIASTYKSWNTLQTNGNIHLGGSKSLSSAVNVRMEQGKSIAISLRPMLGIEVGRLVFTGDSVIVVDKLHKQYIAENVAVFTNGLPATVSTLQDILLGRAFIVGEGTYTNERTNSATADKQKGKCVLTPTTPVTGFKYEFAYDEDNNIASLNIVPERAKTTTYSVVYDDVKETEAGKVAHSAAVAGTIKGKPLNFTLTYRDITWNKSVKVDTSIPSGYKKADLSKLSSILQGE